MGIGRFTHFSRLPNQNPILAILEVDRSSVTPCKSKRYNSHLLF